MTRTTYALPAPINGWLVYVAQGWRLPWIVQPCEVHHGHYSILLTRDDAP